jgi:hypothetical protein
VLNQEIIQMNKI